MVCYVCVEYVGAFVDTAPGLLGWLWCVCYVCVEYVDAFVDTAPGLLGWLWCVLRLCGIRGRVCGHCAWFAGMIWCVFTYVWYA